MFCEESREIIWTPEEDNKLLNYAKEYKQNWADAPHFLDPSKSATDYKMRYIQLTNKKTGAWTAEEDKKLLELIQVYGEGNWSEIASDLPNRTGKQCRDHFTNQLDPKINKAPWTEKEDQLLLDLSKQYGNQWRLIRQNMNRRSELQIKNRFKKLTNYLDEGPIEFYTNEEILDEISKSKQLYPIINSTKNVLKNIKSISLKLSMNEGCRIDIEDGEKEDDKTNELFLTKVIQNEINRFSQISKYELNPYSLRKGIILYNKLENHKFNRRNNIFCIPTASSMIRTNPINTLPVPLSNIPQQPQQLAVNMANVNNNNNNNIQSNPSQTSNSQLHQFQQQQQLIQQQMLELQLQQQQQEEPSAMYGIKLPPPPTIHEDMEDCLQNDFPALIPVEQQQQQQPIILTPLIPQPSPSPPPPNSNISSNIQLQNDGMPYYIPFYPNGNIMNIPMSNDSGSIELSYVQYQSVDYFYKPKYIDELENPLFSLKHFFQSIEENNIQFDLPFSQRFPDFKRIDNVTEINDIKKD